MTPTWEREGVQLYLADCREVLPHVRADAVVTDPPYGVGFEYATYHDSEESWMQLVPPAIQMCRAITKTVAVCMSTKRFFDMPRPNGFVCWAHPGSTRHNTFGGFSEWEPILIYGRWQLPNDYKRLPDCRNHAAGGIVHPCPKPVALMEWLVEGVGGGTIIDPFMGSGTTGIACARAGLPFIGIEHDPTYFAEAKRRIIAEQDAMPMIKELEAKEKQMEFAC